MVKLSTKEIRVLRMVAQKNSGASMTINAASTDRLRRAGLVKGVANGNVQISSAGQAALRRQDILKRITKQPTGTAEGGLDIAVEDIFRAQHQNLKVAYRMVDGERRKVLVNSVETPLGWLLSRKDKAGNSLITHKQYDAGERLRVDFELAGIGRSITSRWDGLPIGGDHQNGCRGLDPGDVQVMAQRRFNDAVEMLGAGMSDIAIRVCCYLEGLSECEKTLGWPARSGKLVLGMALDRLQEHYKE